jgi:glycosyltransferase involved in cell wall biosynthesis
VLAPAITGIPELVKHGITGFLYRAGSLEDFVAKIKMIHDSQPALPRLRRAARQHVLEHFDREKNLAALADLFVSRIAS